MKKTTKKLLFGSLGLLALLAVLLLSVKHDKGVETFSNSSAIEEVAVAVEEPKQVESSKGTERHLAIPEKYQKKVPRKEILARIEREKEQLPKRGDTPRVHHVVSTSGNSCEAISKPKTRDYEHESFKIVDYREVLDVPSVRKSDYRGVVTCEWLLSLDDDMAAIIVRERYHEFENGERELIGTSEFAADQIVAQVKAEHSLLAFRDLIETEGLHFAEVLLTDEKGNSLVVVTAPEATLDTVDDAIAALKRTGMCIFIEVDSVMRPSKTSNDPYLSDQWWLSKVGTQTAWNTTTGSSSILVGVVDTGIAFFHPDLKDNLWRGPNGEYGINTFGGQNSIEDYWVIDDVGHGTMVSGIIGAVGNNSIGVSGVNWKTKIVTVNYTLCGGTNMGFATDSVAGFEYCKKQGCRVINFSSGALANDEVITQASIQTFNAGINSLRSSGIILVCAAGNEANNNDSLANYPSNCAQDNVIAVAASTKTDTLASFSNYGKNSVDIAAPGDDILSTCVFTEDFENYTAYYDIWDGTSFAAPAVTGALALLMSKYPNENYLSLINRLYTSADKISGMASKIPEGRRLNVANAFNLISPPSSVTASKGDYTDKIEVKWSSVSGASYYRVYCATSENAAPSALSSWQTGTSYNHTSAKADTTYYYWVKSATSSSGANASAYSSTAAVGYLKPADTDDIDDYEPNNHMDTAVVLSPSNSTRTHGPHGLVYDTSASQYNEDTLDVFKINMVAGTTYVFESQTIGGSSENKDLYAIVYDSDGYYLFIDDDGGDEDGGYGFKVVYTARVTGIHYLGVRAYNTPEVKYNLSYRKGTTDDRNYNVIEFDELSNAGETVILNLDSGEESDSWVFETASRPSWIESMILTIGTNQVTLGTGTRSVNFAGEAQLAITAAANTTASKRSWNDFNVINDQNWQVHLTQAAGSTVSAPTGVTATKNQTDKITVSWNAVTGASRYRVARATSLTGTKTHFSWTTVRSWNDSDVTAGATYYYWVQASPYSDGSQPSAYSDVAEGMRGTPVVEKYKLTVTNGTGSGEYVEGQKVSIKADNPSVGEVFSRWGGDIDYITEGKNTDMAVTITMPKKPISLRAEYHDVGDGEQNPFGEEPVSYPTAPLQLVYVNVLIDGLHATEGDWLAAYCGNEMRGQMKLSGGGQGWLKISSPVSGEKITFKVYDNSSSSILDTIEYIESNPGDSTTYTQAKPLEIYANTNDPYISPVEYPTNPLLLAKVELTMMGSTPSRGDIIAVFCGNELRGKSTISSPDGIAVVKISRASANGEVLRFMVWDASESKEYQALFGSYDTGKKEYVYSDTYTTKSGITDIGFDNIVKLVVTPERLLELNFIKGWNAFSLNVETDSCSIVEFLGEEHASKAVRMEQENLVWWPPNLAEFETVEAAKQYWLLMSAAATIKFRGVPVDLADEERNTFVFKMNKKGDKQQPTWCSLPYILPEPSDLKQTLQSLLENRNIRIDRILSSNGKVFMPSDPSSQALTVMTPGETYWIRFMEMKDSSGDYVDSITFSYKQSTTQSYRAALTEIAAADDALPEEWKNLIAATETNPLLQRNLNISLDYFGCNPDNLTIAVFRKEDDAFLGSAEFSKHYGAEGISYYAKASITQNIGTEVYFKIWDQGEPEESFENPFLVTDAQGAAVAFTIIRKDDNEDGQQDDLDVALTVTGTAPQYRIEFVLTYGSGDQVLTATQLDDTPLVQYVTRNGAATPPAVKAPAHYVVNPWEDQMALYTNVTSSHQIIISFSPADEQTHSADLNGDWVIDIDELSRVINLYQAGSYHVEENGGYGIGEGSQDGMTHSADLNSDWVIDIDELGRVINLYQAGGYHQKDDGSYGIGKQE